MSEFLANLTGTGGLLRVRATAFLLVLGATAYLFVAGNEVPNELVALDLTYGAFYFGTRAASTTG